MASAQSATVRAMRPRPKPLMTASLLQSPLDLLRGREGFSFLAQEGPRSPMPIASKRASLDDALLDEPRRSSRAMGSASEDQLLRAPVRPGCRAPRRSAAG